MSDKSSCDEALIEKLPWRRPLCQGGTIVTPRPARRGLRLPLSGIFIRATIKLDPISQEINIYWPFPGGIGEPRVGGGRLDLEARAPSVAIGGEH